MAKTMKAAVVHEFGKPLTIEEVPIPQPRAGQILVKIHACGVCGTDLNAARGDWLIMADSNVLMPRDYIQRLRARWRRNSGCVVSVPIASRPANFWAFRNRAYPEARPERWYLQWRKPSPTSTYRRPLRKSMRRDVIVAD